MLEELLLSTIKSKILSVLDIIDKDNFYYILGGLLLVLVVGLIYFIRKRIKKKKTLKPLPRPNRKPYDPDTFRR